MHLFSKDEPNFNYNQTPMYVAYSLPVISTYFLIGAVAILQGVYVKYFGLQLKDIAYAVFFARLFDAITDPVIGYISDRYYDRYKTRKPFVVTGGLLFVVASLFLFIPFDIGLISIFDKNHNDYATEVSVRYFLGWYMAFYLAWTLFEIPHLAWGSEITSTHREKNKVYSFRGAATYIGTLLFFLVPLLPFFDTSEFTPITMAWSVVFAAIFMLPMIYVCSKSVPSYSLNNKSSKNMGESAVGIIDFGKNIVDNKPFLIFIGAFFFAGAGMGMWFGMMFIFVDIFLGLGGILSVVYLLSFGVSILALGFWYYLANQFSKKISWALGMLLLLSGILATSILDPTDSNWLSLLLCMICINAGTSATVALSPAVLTEIIDFGILKCGRDFAASYFSLYTLVMKLNVAIGGAVGLMVAGVYGFDPLATIQSDAGIFGLRLAVSWLPAFIVLFAIVFILLTPISIRKHGIILRRINSKKGKKVPHTERNRRGILRLKGTSYGEW